MAVDAVVTPKDTGDGVLLLAVSRDTATHTVEYDANTLARTDEQKDQIMLPWLLKEGYAHTDNRRHSNVRLGERFNHKKRESIFLLDDVG